jgi:hypothetical protein
VLDNKFVWLLLGLVIGAYVVPMLFGGVQAKAKKQ